ncbi:MAG: helix-turn-helix transcriptional regulator [Alphaproteobacteria bacterium]
MKLLSKTKSKIKIKLNKDDEVSKKAKRGRTQDGDPNPIDTHVGNRIRLRRTLLGLSQEKLASMLGLTFQQVQKYERGANRVGASRLYDIAQALEVQIGFFYEDMDNETAAQSPMTFAAPQTAPLMMSDNKVEFDDDPMHKKEAMELVRAYYKIQNRKVAKHLFDMVIQMSKTSFNNEENEE